MAQRDKLDLAARRSRTNL